MHLRLIPILLMTSAPAVSADWQDAQLRRLFEPTKAELKQERGGRVYIYESLTTADISRAMDQEFDRVDSMMFIRVQVADDKGEVIKDPDTGDAMVQDDGC